MSLFLFFKRRVLFSVVMFSLVGAGVFPTTLVAANFSAVPLAHNLDVAKRDIVTKTVTLTNTTDRMVRLYASVNEVALDGSGALKSFVQPSMTNRKNSPTSWFAITRGRIELAPGEVQEIPFTVTMNPQTEPGNYSVFIGFAEANNEPTARQKIMGGDGVGTLVNLRVDQTQTQFLRLARFNVERFIDGKEELTISFDLHNPSQVDIVPRGEIVLYDLKGNELFAHSLNQEAVSIAPSDRVTFSEEVEAPASIGKYKAFMTVEYGTAIPGTLTDTAFFYVLPLWKLFMLFLGLLAIALVITVVMYRRMHHQRVDDHDVVTMFVKNDRSPDMHHDINLSQPVTTSETHENDEKNS